MYTRDRVQGLVTPRDRDHFEGHREGLERYV